METIMLFTSIKHKTTVCLLSLVGFCISCHNITIKDKCGCTKSSFWSSSRLILDSIMMEHYKTLFLFVDSGRLIRADMKPYNMSIIQENFKSIDPYGFQMWPKLDSSIFSFAFFDTLRQLENFRQDIVIEYRYLEGIDFNPFQAYRIIVTRNNKFISSTLIAEDESIIGGHSTICSSFVFSDSLILRKTCRYYADRTVENLELLTFNKVSGSYKTCYIFKRSNK